MAFLQKLQSGAIRHSDIRQNDINRIFLQKMQSCLQECHGIQPDVKSVILSGYGEFEYAQKALRLGSFDFLTKPVDFSQLTAIFLKLHDTLSQLETQNRNLQEVYRLKKDNFFHNVTKYSVEPETLAQRCREYNLPPFGRYGILRIRYPDAENCLPGLPPDCREAVSRLIGESGGGDRCYVFPNEAHEITVALYDIPKGETTGLLELLIPYSMIRSSVWRWWITMRP